MPRPSIERIKSLTERASSFIKLDPRNSCVFLTTYCIDGQHLLSKLNRHGYEWETHDHDDTYVTYRIPTEYKTDFQLEVYHFLASLADKENWTAKEKRDFQAISQLTLFQ